MLIQAVLWAFCLPLLPICWFQQKMIRRRFPKRCAVTLPAGWSGGASPGESPRRLLGIGDHRIVPAEEKDLGQGITANCAESLMRQSVEKTVWQVAGRPDATASDVLGICRTIDALNVDLILISIGVNDVLGLTSLVKWQTAIFDLIILIRAKGDAKIIFLGLPPMARCQPLPQPLRVVCGVRALLLDAVLRRSIAQLDFAAHLAFDDATPADQVTDGGCRLATSAHQRVGARAGVLFSRLLKV